MEYSKTPRHNKVRHNVVAPMPEEFVKRRIVPPFAQWIDETNSKHGNKWTGENNEKNNIKLSRKNAFPHLTSPTKKEKEKERENNKHNNVSVNNISLTASTIVTEKDGVQMVEEEEIVKHDVLPGNLNGEHDLRGLEEGKGKGRDRDRDRDSGEIEREGIISDGSSISSKKTFSQHSLLSTDVETSSVDTTREYYPPSSSGSIRTNNSNNNNNLYGIGGVGVGLAMGIGGIRVPNIEMLTFNNNNNSFSGNMETFERLAEASGHRKGSILKNSSAYDFFATPKSHHGSARIIREDERRVSWSDLHHGKELTQVREVEYGESKLHRILRQNRGSVILTSILFVFCMVAIAVVLAVTKATG